MEAGIADCVLSYLPIPTYLCIVVNARVQTYQSYQIGP